MSSDRDLTVAADRLRDWFARGSARDDVQIHALDRISGGGYSGDLLMGQASWRIDGRKHDQGFVVRIEPTPDYQLFLDTNFEAQYRVLDVLHDKSTVPVPATLGFEEDPEVLGSRFYVMDRVSGSPGLIGRPWIDAIKDQGRDTVWPLWWKGLEAMAQLHRVDIEEVGLTSLYQPRRGEDALDQQLHYYREYYNWVRGGVDYPAIEEAFAWLTLHKPQGTPTSILWGDARRGNQMFTDTFECTGLLDFEMVALGPAEADLGWWLYTTEVELHEPMENWCPTTDETVSAYGKMLGRDAQNMNIEYYLVLAALKVATLMIKLQELRGGNVDGFEKTGNTDGLTRAMQRFT